MGKILEIIGLLLIAGTFYSFVGMTESDLRWPVFWICAGGALTIIVYSYFKGSMAKQTSEWWKGLGDELEMDIETLSYKTKDP